MHSNPPSLCRESKLGSRMTQIVSRSPAPLAWEAQLDHSAALRHSGEDSCSFSLRHALAMMGSFGEYLRFPKKVSTGLSILSSLPSHLPHPRPVRVRTGHLWCLEGGHRFGSVQANFSHTYTKGNYCLNAPQHLLSCPEPGPHSWPLSRPKGLLHAPNSH